MLEKTEGTIKNRQSTETGNIGHTKRTRAQQTTQHNMCWIPLYASKTGYIVHTRHKTNTNTANNTTQYVLDTSIRKQTQIT
jgi:hypothetical protein